MARPGSNKRPVTFQDAFGIEEEDDQVAPRNAKISRNLGAQILGPPGVPKDANARGVGGPYWQQQQVQRPGGVPDGSSSILLSTPVAGMPGGPLVEETMPAEAVLPLKEAKASVSSQKAKVGPPVQTGGSAASPVSSSEAPGKALATEAAPAKPRTTGFFVCWLCKRKFNDYEGFNQHVMFSRLHQETIRRMAGLE
ncbi:unnamed protein product [Polarella glacialis]|uniref:Uncharacterized protein n=1 Tax=Polarella glacialis TaxID=89957 RepID=A0A813H3D9_POLGL|nr:unnamed protein product [Polarella glacialis]